MRIGTWNLAGRWSDDHARFLDALDCDVLLLTEVSDRTALPGHGLHVTEALMARRRAWAAVASRRPLTGVADPHPASALAYVDGLAFCSSILPWRTCGSRPPWVGERHVDKTAHAVEALVAKLPREPLVWGGDWNHALSGREWSGSIGGRGHLLAAFDTLGLHAATAALPHRIDGLLSIDHVAVPGGTAVVGSARVSALQDERALSDHDAYVVEV